MLKSRQINEGSRLNIVATSGVVNKKKFNSVVNWLRNRYEVVYRSDIFSQNKYLAGKDDRRTEEFIDALSDKSSDAIICARGGFGATKILSNIDINLISKSKKLLVGFSDVTALHALWNVARLKSIHAAMIEQLYEMDECDKIKWIKCIENIDQIYQWNLDIITNKFNNDKASQGEFWGGNLSMLIAINGTPFMPNMDDKILFIEDVSEDPYKIDRMLTSLLHSGWFHNLKGLVIGNFTNNNIKNYSEILFEIFEDFFSKFSFPVLYGMSSGHVVNNESLILGSKATIKKNKLIINL